MCPATVQQGSSDPLFHGSMTTAGTNLNILWCEFMWLSHDRIHHSASPDRAWPFSAILQVWPSRLTAEQFTDLMQSRANVSNHGDDTVDADWLVAFFCWDMQRSELYHPTCSDLNTDKRHAALWIVLCNNMHSEFDLQHAIILLGSFCKVSEHQLQPQPEPVC